MHNTPHHHTQHQHNNQRTHVIMSPEDVASNRKPDPWRALLITGLVRNLSPALWNMTHLRYLYLNDNRLTRLPPDIGRLTQLRCLDLSNNKLRALPREIGELVHLQELLLNDNLLRTLPLEIGKLFHLKKLGLKGNSTLSQEMLQIYQAPMGTQKLVTYLLEHLAAQYPPPRPPQRPWILMGSPVDKTRPSCMFTTMCYNVLCDKYASRQLYRYCPGWALAWDYRKHSILEEIKAHSADIIALQEVETEQYQDFFLRELQADGYEGLFSPKSRAKTMPDFEKKHVDGCAIFYRTNKFSLITEHLIEFNQLAMANAEGSDDMLNRVMTKDNIALVALLQIKDGAFDSFGGGGGGGGGGGPSGTNAMNSSSNLDSSSGNMGGNVTVATTNSNSIIDITTRPLHQQRILVCSAHIHWDPEFCDVKIVQSIMLTHELQAIANKAARDLLASSGESINSIKQYLNDGMPSESSPERNHFGRSSQSNFMDQDEFIPSGGDDSCLDQLGAEIIPIILCIDSNSLPESSVVEFLRNGFISSDHQDFKELAYQDCLRKICNSRSSALANSQHSQQNQCNQYSGQSSKSSSISTTISSSSTSSTDEQPKLSNDSFANTSNGNGNQRSTTKTSANHNSTSSPSNNSDIENYTHPFSFATAYTGEGAMPYTNYTFDFKGVIDYIFYSQNLMSVLGVSGLDKTWLEENKIPGLPHPYFPSDHLPLYVELEILPTPRRKQRVKRFKQLQNHTQQPSQTQPQPHPQAQATNPQYNQKNDFFQNPMRKSYFGT